MALVRDVYCDFVTFQFGILEQVWYLIVSIPDPCCLSYFDISRRLSCNSHIDRITVRKRILRFKLNLNEISKPETQRYQRLLTTPWFTCHARLGPPILCIKNSSWKKYNLRQLDGRQTTMNISQESLP